MSRPSNYSIALVVERDPTIQIYIADKFRSKGIVAKIATSAQEAVKLIKLFPHDFLVCNQGLATASSENGNVLDVKKSYEEKCKEAGGGVYIPMPVNAKSQKDINKILEESFK